ncbi:MAG: M23 family metallopeptidase [Abditibacteriota bacterium]|nr:M23 family metallopeptidase [Oscillospiraceae bacterium]MBQ9359066.1 M23 family metallopeptidase [Abditibacteriota bacterium]
MEDKKNLVKKLDSFIEGRGFYIVLLACVAIISVAALTVWVPGFDILKGSDPEDGGVSDIGGNYSPAMVDGAETDMYGQEPPAEEGKTRTEDEAGDKTDTLLPEAVEVEADDEDGGESEAESPAETEPAAVPAAAEIVVEAGEISFIWPVTGDISQEYAVDRLIFSKTMGDWRAHPGVDISARLGDKVCAAAGGTVKELYKDDLLGTCLVIDHGQELSSVYANLAALPAVSAGDSVEQGQVIGSVGDTAIGETGEVSHLHFAVRRGDEWQDPMDYLT